MPEVKKPMSAVKRVTVPKGVPLQPITITDCTFYTDGSGDNSKAVLTLAQAILALAQFLDGQSRSASIIIGSNVD